MARSRGWREGLPKKVLSKWRGKPGERSPGGPRESKVARVLLRPHSRLGLTSWHGPKRRLCADPKRGLHMRSDVKPHFPTSKKAMFLREARESVKKCGLNRGKLLIQNG